MPSDSVYNQIREKKDYLAPAWNANPLERKNFLYAMQVVLNICHIIKTKGNRLWHACFSKDHQWLNNTKIISTALENVKQIKVPFTIDVDDVRQLDPCKKQINDVKAACSMLKIMYGLNNDVHLLEKELGSIEEKVAKVEQKTIEAIEARRAFAIEEMNKRHARNAEENTLIENIINGKIPIPVDRDLEPIFDRYLTDAEFGNPSAMPFVVMCYENGLGVEKDEEEATMWFENLKSHFKGTAPLHQLAKYYTETRPDRAKELYMLAIVVHDPKAMMKLAEILENEGDIQGAIHNYRLAAKDSPQNTPERIKAAKEGIVRLEPLFLHRTFEATGHLYDDEDITAPQPVAPQPQAEPEPVIPQPQAAPQPVAPQPQAELEPVIPQSQAAPQPVAPQPQAEPEPVIPQPQAASQPIAPQPEAEPEPAQETPKTHAEELTEVAKKIESSASKDAYKKAIALKDSLKEQRLNHVVTESPKKMIELLELLRTAADGDIEEAEEELIKLEDEIVDKFIGEEPLSKELIGPILDELIYERKTDEKDLYRLLKCMQSGYGTPKQIKDAVKKFTKLASKLTDTDGNIKNNAHKKNVAASICLSVCYKHGLGVEQNQEKRDLYYRNAVLSDPDHWQENIERAQL